MNQQQQYVGLDVSLETTSICVIDDEGATVLRVDRSIGKSLRVPKPMSWYGA